MTNLLIAWVLVISMTPGVEAHESESPGNGIPSSGDLRQVLTEFAGRCHIPMLVEIAEPLPHVRLDATTCDPGQFLSQITKRQLNYSYKLHGRAIHFFDKTLLLEEKNFLGWKLTEFRLPSNVAEFKNALAARLGAKRAGFTGKGGLVDGLLPFDLSKRALPPKSYVDASTREIVLDVEDMDGSFANIVVFPRRHGITDADLDSAFGSWQWKSILPETPAPKVQR